MVLMTGYLALFHDGVVLMVEIIGRISMVVH